MRTAYALLALLWLFVLGAGVYAFEHGFTRTEDTGQITSSSISNMATPTLRLTSSAFENGGMIPARFTCDEDRTINPALSITGVPEAAKSLALIMDDPDVPKALKPAGVFDHWVLFNILPTTNGIPEGGSAGVAGANGAGQNTYTGPCPPAQYEPSEHRYFFKLYALDATLPLSAGASKADVEKAMQGHIIAQTELMGRYKRR